MKVLLTQDQVREGVARMAEEVMRTYEGRPLTIVGVLTGSVVLVADLIRLLQLPLRLGVIYASSYRAGATSRGKLVINSEWMPDVKGRDVLLVDDIFDTGHTLLEVCGRMRELGAASVRTAVLLSKRGRKEVDLAADFVAFEIPNEFVVGYGLDYRDLYRNLPYIASLEPGDLAGDQGP